MKVYHKAFAAVSGLLAAALVTFLLYLKFRKDDRSSETSHGSFSVNVEEKMFVVTTDNSSLLPDSRRTADDFGDKKEAREVRDKNDLGGVQNESTDLAKAVLKNVINVPNKSPKSTKGVKQQIEGTNIEHSLTPRTVTTQAALPNYGEKVKPNGETSTNDDPTKAQVLTPNVANIQLVPTPNNLKRDPNKEKAAKQYLLDQNRFLKTCSPHFNDKIFSTPFKVPRASCAAALHQDPDRFIKSPLSSTAVSAIPEFIDRLQGLAWAAFAGDAFGGAVEFRTPDEVLKTFPLIRKPTDYDKSIWAPYWKGLWTDDSTSALCLAAAYIKSRFLDCNTHFETLKRWVTENYMYVVNDIGPSSSKALKENEISKASSTNGCIMRMWPNVFFHSLHPIEDAVDASAASALLTHVHTVCRDSSRLMAAIIWDLLHGAKKEDVLSPMYKQRHAKLWSDRPFSAIFKKNVADLLENPASANFSASSSNYEADEALRVALAAFRETDNLLDGFLYCVRKGADTDTTATIYGQIAGAYYGKSHIVKNFPWMIERLYAKPALEQLINAMTIIAQDHYAELPKMDIFDNNGEVVSFNMAHLQRKLQCSANPPYWNNN